MAVKEGVSKLGLSFYSCPHCGALSHQTWLAAWAKNYTGNAKPALNLTANMVTSTTSVHRKIMTSVMKTESANIAVGNVFFSVCYSCKEYAVWFADQLIHPNSSTVVLPHEDMPDDIKADFLEA